MNDLNHCYRLLELEPGASLEQIKQAYRDLVFVWHPDRYPDANPRLKQKAHEKLQQINAAYEQLQNRWAEQITTPRQTATPSHSPRPTLNMRDLARLGNEQAIAALLNAEVVQMPGSQRMRARVRFQSGQLRVMLGVVESFGQVMAVALIYTALERLRLGCIKTVKVFGIQAGSSQVWHQQFDLPAPSTSATRFAFDHLETNLLAYPIAFLAASIISNTDLLRLLHLPWHTWTHAMGHLSLAWLAGRPFMMDAFNGGVAPQSLGMSLLVLASLGLWFWSGQRQRQIWTMAAAAGLAVIQFILTCLMPERSLLLLNNFAGVAGEFLGSTALMLAFYLPGPDRLRWDFWRFPVLVMAASSLWRSSWLWLSIDRVGLHAFARFDEIRHTASEMFGLESATTVYKILMCLCALALAGSYSYHLLQADPAQRFGLKQRLIVWWAMQSWRQQFFRSIRH